MNKRRKWRFNPIGETYGNLTVISEAERMRLPSGQKPRVFICRCICGTEKQVLGLHLVRGRITSCGCINRTMNGESQTPIGRCYKGMKDRCSPTYSERHIYFDKGIRVCEEWDKDYFAFREWALENGFKKGLQIDRIDNSKGYQPDNCRFVENLINVNNRDITFYVTYKGNKEAICLLLRRLNKLQHYTAITQRIKRGWEHDKAIDTPIKTGAYKRNLNKSFVD